MSGSAKTDKLNEAAEWFFRQDGVRLSVSDEISFQSWLAASDENRAAYAEISGTWDELAQIPQPAVMTAPIARHNWWSKSVSAAFASVFLLAAGAWYSDVATRISADGYTGTGELQTMHLPDGSIAEMNSGTAIALSYSPDERRIRLLKGEAVFTVSADPQRPFIVEANGGEAVALGTVYGVRDDDNGATVTVIESHVAISASANGQQVKLGQDQRISYMDGKLASIQSVDAASETAWRRNKLIFVDKPLGEVVDELNRYHKGMIRIIDGSIRSRRVSGVFETTDIIKVIDTLKKSFGLNDTRLGEMVILIHQ
ncbi:FecR family protein [Paenochrobactrum sp. BZR 588]|uniref:FecR family protein n=1 Tax=Paenochrobactrum TaxID=999488 RepID=UPI0035BBFD82